MSSPAKAKSPKTKSPTGAKSPKPNCAAPGCTNKAAPTSANGYCSYHSSTLPDSKKHTAPDPTSSQHQKNAVKNKGTVFDKLTDTSQYSGTHKNRFDASGHGLGEGGNAPGHSQEPIVNEAASKGTMQLHTQEINMPAMSTAFANKPKEAKHALPDTYVVSLYYHWNSRHAV